MSPLHVSALVLALWTSLAWLPTTALAGDDYEKGYKQGWAYAHAAASARGLADGRAAGDAAGYAQGLEDERARQAAPPRPGSGPAVPPAAGEASPDAAFLAGLRQQALADHPELRPEALSGDGPPPTTEPVSSPLLYTRGFGEGMAAGLAQGYIEGRKRGFEEGFATGHRRGCDEFLRLYRRADGSYVEPRAEIELGRQAALAGRYQEALQRFDVAITSEGAGDYVPEALYWKAFTCYEWSKPLDALQTLNRLLTHFPDCARHAQALFLAGASYEKTPAKGFDGVLGRRRYGEAIAMYRRLLEASPDAPDAPEAAYRVGYNLELLGDRPAACEAFRHVLARYPGTKAATRSKEMLQRLAGAAG